MGVLDLFRARPIVEVATAEPVQEAVEMMPKVPSRQGYEFGVPRSEGNNQAYRMDRAELMKQMYDAYMGCNWVSACIDTIAASVVAGGLRVVPDDDVPEGTQPTPPPAVQSLERLVKYTNDREDMVQLLRSTITDLMVFGDAYMEVTYVLGQPIALYTLDAATMSIISDQHGNISSYIQVVDNQTKATFEPDEVIHISLDAPRGGLYGVSPTQKARLPIASWLFWAAILLETGRRGDPSNLHIDLPKGTTDEKAQKVWEKYISHNLGAHNKGTPLVTIGGAAVQELSQNQIAMVLETMRQLRDEIIAEYAVPPNKVQIVESGNLGGGTGEAQDKNWRTGRIIPLQSLILEKLNYAIVMKGYQIDGWHMEFGEVDYRDSSVVENIRKDRIATGQYTVNRARSEIGEPPVPGGDDPFVQLSRSVVYVKDLAEFTQAEIDQMQGGPGQAQQLGAGGAPYDKIPAGAVPGGTDNAPEGKAPKETNGPDEDLAALKESWKRAYQHRRKKALKELKK